MPQPLSKAQGHAPGTEHEGREGRAQGASPGKPQDAEGGPASGTAQSAALSTSASGAKRPAAGEAGAGEKGSSSSGPGPVKRAVLDDEQLEKYLDWGRPSFVQRNRYQAATLVLIAVNVIVYAAEVVLSGFDFSVSALVLFDMGAMYPPVVHSLGDLYRFVAPMFLHFDLMHLGLNMLALYSVGGVLERMLGKRNYLALYLVGGVTGNAVTYAAVALFGGAPSLSAGASTSVFGLFVAVALLGLLCKGDRSVLVSYSKSMLGIIVINIVYTFAVPGISVTGHLGGALGGLFAMFMLPSKNLRGPRSVRAGVALVWLLGLVGLLASQGLLLP